MSPRERAALLGFARGLGWVLGPLVLFCLLPVGLCRLTCVPLRETCEAAGGDHVELADVSFCEMPVPVDDAHPCPAGYSPSRARDDDLLCSGGFAVAACVMPGSR